MTRLFQSSTLALLAIGLISSVLIAPKAQAVPITGSINFSGGVQLNNTSAGNSTAVTGWADVNGAQPTVSSASGSFSSVPVGTTASFTAPWNFNSVGPLLLWQVGGFTFTLSQSNIVSQGAGSVVVQGFGILSGNGFDPTAGIWRFYTQDPSVGAPPTFAFSTNREALPEGGATVALLSVSLTGLARLRHKLRKQRSV